MRSGSVTAIRRHETCGPDAAQRHPHRRAVVRPVVVAISQHTQWKCNPELRQSVADRSFVPDVGGDYVSVTTSAVGANSSGSSQANQFLGGVLGGYNWQTGPWVFGVEGDWSSIANARNPDQITTLEASYLASAKSSRRSNEPLVQWPVVVLKRGSLIILACGLKVCTSTAEPSVTIFPRPFSTAVSYPQGRTTTSVNTRSTERA